MVNECPGAVNIRMPRLEVKDCPKCGEEIEIVSNEASARCPKCGFVVYNDLLSCVEWCEYARQCVGDKAYERVMEQLAQRKQAEPNQ
ncbi:MAG: hypothetical protein A2Y91_06195 [Chloroflexi bacterium RBG_13_54_8]|nr:MAG: hypothetical protein A2Y91_06195 [Chloroflexi bacterium RBG_13_54_8]